MSETLLLVLGLIITIGVVVLIVLQLRKPPPAVDPLHAAINFNPECALESSMPFRVSLVNLQKLTFHAWLESPSI